MYGQKNKLQYSFIHTNRGSVDLSLVTSRYLKGLNCTIFWKRYQLRQFYRWKASSCRYLGILRSGGPWIGDRGIYFLQKLKLFHKTCQNFGNFSEISNFCQTLPYSTKQNFWNSFFPLCLVFLSNCIKSLPKLIKKIQSSSKA